MRDTFADTSAAQRDLRLPLDGRACATGLGREWEWIRGLA